MTPDVRRFLKAWFLMFGWVALLGAGMGVNVFISDRVHNELVRWLLNVASLIGTIKLGVMLYDRVFSHADPHDPLRAEAAKLGADTEG